jgi:hypothetical protein
MNSTKIKAINLYQSYPSNMLVGEIEFENEYGGVKIRVNREMAGKIVVLLADALVATTRETAAIMKSNIIDQVREYALPAPQPKENE